MGEWNQDSMPKRMQQAIKAVKDKIKEVQRAEIKKFTMPPVATPCVSCGSTMHSTANHSALRSKIRTTKPKLPKTINSRVAAIQISPSKPALTHKRRRWLRKHRGYPVDQYPWKGPVTTEERREA